jgi:F0F1-type ATP synthase delta subunit
MELTLPTVIASRQDITHVHRELRLFDDAAMQSVLRHENPVKYPPISTKLRGIVQQNQIDLRDDASRKKLLDALEKLKTTAPTIHISFPAEPSPEVLQKLVTWLRKEIDPRIVIRVGMQPTIAAGVIVRTPNQQFDFSLRQHLQKNRSKLIERLI